MANIRTLPVAKSKTTDYRDPRARHIDDWKKASSEARDKAIGANIDNEAEELYCLRGSRQNVPQFRPEVRIPELQKIILDDANQISNLAPKPFIFSRGERVQDREAALQAQWQASNANLQLLYASIYARYKGVGFIQLCYDPDMNNGEGGLWWSTRDPATVFMDASPSLTWDPAYIGWTDHLPLEEIRKRWPMTANSVRPTNAPPLAGSDSGYGIQMPEGPMRSMPSLTSSADGQGGMNDSRIEVTYCFCKDYTRELVEKDRLPDGALTDPEFQWKYPNGRWLVECQGFILYDGDNPWPTRADIPAPGFPLFPIWSLPPVFSPWGVPVTHLSLNLQEVAERMMTQLYENGVRLNNGTWFVDSNTGIDIEAFGGMPGEVQQIQPNTRVPAIVYGGNMPAQAFQFPQQLLQIQRDVHGLTDARQGNPGAGNISSDLFDASVLQSSGLLQLAGRLQYQTVLLMMTAMYRAMAKFLPSRKIPWQTSTSGMQVAEWKGLLRPDTYHDVYLDEDSVRPLSDTVLRNLAPKLMETGVLDTERGLNLLGVPDAEEIAKQRTQQMQLAALGKVARGGR